MHSPTRSELALSASEINRALVHVGIQHSNLAHWHMLSIALKLAMAQDLLRDAKHDLELELIARRTAHDAQQTFFENEPNRIAPALSDVPCPPSTPHRNGETTGET